MSCKYAKRRLIVGKSGKSYYVYTPCGKCYTCRKRMAAEWAFRCKEEAIGQYVYNMLLTYDNAHLPMYKGTPVLNREHLVSAMKRLRYYLSKSKITIRFFGCGEYSPEEGRPHYHVIIFSDKPLEQDGNLEWLNGTFKDKQRLSYGKLHNVWFRGDVSHITPFDPSKGNIGNMVGYMVSYMTTYNNSLLQDKQFRPFRCQSRGLGRSLLERKPEIIENCRARHNYTYSVQVTLFDGSTKTNEYPYPKYFRNKMITEYDADNNSERWYEYSVEYYHYITNLSPREIQFHLNQLQLIRENEKRIEQENYRKIKVHQRANRF